MKVIKVLLAFILVSTIAVSCKESKKEEIQDDAAVEVSEGSSDAAEAEGTGGEMTSESTEDNSAAGAASGAAAAGGEKDPVQGIESSTKGIEELAVPEGVLAEEMSDTPVVYPGCSGSIEEIRVCNRESFIAFIQKEFNKNLAPSLNLGDGEFEIRSLVHIDEAGKVSSLKIVAPHQSLENEMKRVIDLTPSVVPATEAGEPVAVSFLLPVKFKVEI